MDVGRAGPRVKFPPAPGISYDLRGRGYVDMNPLVRIDRTSVHRGLPARLSLLMALAWTLTIVVSLRCVGCAKRGMSGGGGTDRDVTTAPSMIEESPARRAVGQPRPNLDTPQAATRAYGEAMRDGDVTKFRAIYHLSPREEPYIDLIAQWVVTSVRLEQVATRRFGHDAAERILNSLLLPAPGPTGRGLLESLDRNDFKVEIIDDTAQVLVDPVGRLDFRKVEREWKFVAEGPTDLNLEQTLKKPDEWQGRLVKILVPTQRAIAEGIDSGKYPTPDAAIEAVGRLLLEIGQREGVIPKENVGPDGGANGQLPPHMTD
jgi:hypothetical protein